MNNDIWNTTCPVCGACVPETMPLIELGATSGRGSHAHEEQPGLRMCSQPCAAVAQASPEKYRAIASASIVRTHDSSGVRPR